MIGVVIPTLNEARYLPGLLDDLSRLGRAVPLDVVVADGGSSDATAAAALRGGARVIALAPGRGRQLNAGAATVRGSWLLFLHADSRLPAEGRRALLAAVVDEPGLAAGVFGFAIELPAPWKRFIEWGQALRERLYHLPYGDQGLLIRRDVFQAVGGYPDIPVMEDVAMVRALRKRGVVIHRLPAALVTSGRRYRARGVVRTWLGNALLIGLYLLGVSPQRLARWRAA
ncbi:MAG TPA: TIGR04283 family arsenosugar biosynthesis glycosyltransferase [Gemmatimonadales bacterium]|nr:TIGR04283 family arsenosugar biosynthesis glycosyltransferase [Gemmatimonadales bacterium]